MAATTCFHRVGRALGLVSVFISIVDIKLSAADPRQSSAATEELEARFINPRRELRSGRVAIRIHYNALPASPASTRVDHRYTLYFHGDKWRADLESVDLASGASAIISRTILTRDQFIRDLQDQDEVQLAGPATKPKATSEISDPRLLGLVAWYFESIKQHGFETYFLRPDREGMRTESALDDNGHSITKVTYRLRHGKVDCQYWLTAANQPIYIASQWAEPGIKGEQWMRSKLKHYTKPDFWYPSEVTFRQTANGRVQAEQIATVENAVFDQEIPDSVFSLAGLGLSIGRVVSEGTRSLTWDGRSLVPLTLHEPWPTVPAPGTPQSNSRWKWLLLGNSLALAAVAVFAIIRRRPTKGRG